MYYRQYQMEVARRSRDARTCLVTGDLDAALNGLDEILATAEQNLGCVQVAPPMQLAMIGTLLRDCTSAPDRSIDQSVQIRTLTSRFDLLLQSRTRRRSAGSGGLSTRPKGLNV